MTLIKTSIDSADPKLPVPYQARDETSPATDPMAVLVFPYLRCSCIGASSCGATGRPIHEMQSTYQAHVGTRGTSGHLGFHNLLFGTPSLITTIGLSLAPSPCRIH